MCKISIESTYRQNLDFVKYVAEQKKKKRLGESLWEIPRRRKSQVNTMNGAHEGILKIAKPNNKRQKIHPHRQPDINTGHGTLRSLTSISNRITLVLVDRI